jgi:tRNA(adenine34) deaminase
LSSTLGDGDHERWMEHAFREAERALAKEEVPVGAVVVFEDRIIGRGHNLIETLQDPTAHAEIIALTAAANSQTSWCLTDTTLYVTLEPCPMCVGAVLLSRVRRLVFGAHDSRWGACGSVVDSPSVRELDSTLEVLGGISAERSSALLREFFGRLRSK